MREREGGRAEGMSDLWQGRRVFVTGVMGVVGSWLVKGLLIKGADVIGLTWNAGTEADAHWNGDLRDVRIERGSLEDFQGLERFIRKHQVNTVFHLGGQAIVSTAHRSPLLTFEANIRGTYNLLEACRLHRDFVQRVVIASSDKAYGEPTLLPITEEMPLNGRHPYDVSKSCADLLAQAYHRTYDLPVAIARCGNVYGGGDLNWSRVVPRTIRALLSGERPLIRGDGSHIRDYIYVKDVVRAYLRLAEALEDDRMCGEAFNFSAEKPTTVLEMVTMIQRLMGSEHIEANREAWLEGELRVQYLSARKARILLDWKPAYDLEDGLRETIVWYREYLRH